jgi:hypothetical protein
LTILFDDTEHWLEDPTRLLNSWEIFNRTVAWKSQAAADMVINLCDWSSANYYQAGHGGAVSTWINAADEYHIQRMEQTISADFAIQKLKVVNAASYNQSTTFTSQGQIYQNLIRFERLGVMLAKLKVPSMSLVRKEVFDEGVKVVGEVLEERGLKIAKETYFKRLVRASCVGCPQTGLLAFPTG